MTEDLITDLSKVSGIFVIARKSTFGYKGKPVKIKQVAEELGVRYVLEGSVRKVGEKVRINAQLIDATTGHHLWGDRYDGKLGDVFSLQDKITQKIVAALAVKLTAGEKKHVARKETDNIAAYDAFLQGWEHYLRLTADDFAKAVPYFEKAVELDPNYGRAYAALALTYLISARNYLIWPPKINVSRGECYLLARECLEMSMKNPTSLSYHVAADMMLYRRQHGEAIVAAERAIALDPNDATGQFIMGKVLVFGGRPEAAVEYVKRAMRLDPHYPAEPLCLLGLAHFAMGKLEEAVSSIERGLKHNPELVHFTVPLAAAYAHLGRDKEAQDAVETRKAGWMLPNLRTIMYNWPFKDLKVSDHFVDGLIKAGWLGKPSEYYRVSEEDRLTGEEIRALVFGRKVAGLDGLIDRTKDGKASCRGSRVSASIAGAPMGVAPVASDSGRSWIEGDMLCDQWQTRFQGHKLCYPVFRNPEGTREMFNEYLTITDFGIISWSPVD